MKRTALFSCAITALLLWTWPAVACDNSTIAGSYGYHASGFVEHGNGEVPMPAGGSIPVSLKGHVIFDGNGNLSGDQNSIGGGWVAPVMTFTGTYTINADCTGTATRQFPSGSTAEWRIEVVNGGAEILVLFYEPTVTIEGSLIRK